jgi:hypothetical protein
MQLPFLFTRFAWICIAISCKALLYLVFVYLYSKNYGYHIFENGNITLYVFSADTDSYTRPIENLIRSGNYIADPSQPLSMVIRMPGYGFLYLFFRMFADAHGAKNLLVVLQVLLSGISLYYLAVIAYRICNSSIAFYTTFLLYGLSGLISVYDVYPQSDSLCNSFIIFSFYLLLSAFYVEPISGSFSRSRLFASGCCLALASFLRPATIPLFFLCSLYILAIFIYYRSKTEESIFAQTVNVLLYLLMFAGVFVAFEGLWIYRNYKQLQVFMPLQYNYWLHKTGVARQDVQAYAYEWIVAMGEVNIEYEPGSMAAWLHNNQFSTSSYQLPTHIYTSRYSYDSLQVLRNRFIQFEQTYGFPFKGNKVVVDKYNQAVRDAEATYLNNTFKSYLQYYKLEKPLNYYVLNRLALLKKFTWHTGTGLLPFKLFSVMKAEKDIVGMGFKLVFALNYLLIMTMGFIGMVLLLLHYSFERILVVACAGYGIFIFPFFVGTIDIRFLSLAFPFLSIASGYTFSFFVGKLNLFKIHQNMPIPSPK